MPTPSPPLADVLADLGYAAGASKEAAASVIGALRGAPLAPGGVAGALALLARTAGGRLPPPPAATADALAASLGGLTLGPPPRTWDGAGVGAALRAAAPRLDWPAVAAALDRPDFAVPDAAAFATLMAAWKAGAGSDFPAGAAFGGPWAHAAGQADFIREALAADPATLAVDGDRLTPPSGVPSPPAKAAAGSAAPYAALVAVARAAAGAAPARSALAPSLKAAPAVAAVGLLAARAADSPLAPDLGRALAAVAASPAKGGAAAVADLAARPGAAAAMLTALGALAVSDPVAAPRAADAAAAVVDGSGGKAPFADAVLGSSVLPAPAAVELALGAAGRVDGFDLGAWAAARAAQEGDAFVAAVAAAVAAAAAGAGGRPPLPADAVETLLAGAAAAPSPGPDAAAALARARAAAARAPTDAASSPPAVTPPTTPFPPDVEADANAAFQELYAGRDTADALLTRMAGWAAGGPRDRALAACVAHSLLDEYRFFHKYPDAELAATAALFGGMVSRGLLPDGPLALALRCVLDAAREPPPSKLATFALGALRACAGQLHRFPKYCQQLAGVAALRGADAGLAATLDRVVADAASGRAPPQPTEPALAAAVAGGGVPRAASPARVAGGAAAPAPAASTLRADPARAFSTLNAETLDAAAAAAASVEAPPADVVDRVHFVMNNLAIANVRARATEVGSLVLPAHRAWFAHYLVAKRAAQEPNYHALYAQLADALADRALWDALTDATYTYLRALLASDRCVTQASERSLLKNLGSWLGRLTIARNKPVLARDLDLKAALLDAYSAGKMIAVLPFCHKVLEPCKESRVFRPTNPWLAGILALVAEIYAQDRLKLNLKFEVEMLFRALAVPLESVKPSDLLRAAPRPPPASADFADPRSAAPGSISRSGVLPDAGGSLDAALGGGGDAAFAAAAAGVPGAPPVSSAALGGLAERAQLRRLVPLAVDRAVADVGAPVVERSASIACMAAAELARKDYGADPDDARLRSAAHLAAASLAGSLALVTCREPLRAALAAQLRALLAQVPGLDAATVEHLAAVATADNAELGCALIEKAASDRAVREVDERLAGAVAARASARAAGAPWAGDPAPAGGVPPATLPELLRPRPGGATPAQARVYEDFARLPRARGGVPGGGVGGPGAAAAGAPFGAPPSDDLATLAPGYAAWQARLDAAAAADPGADFWALPRTADLVAIAVEAGDLAACREDVGLAIARYERGEREEWWGGDGWRHSAHRPPSPPSNQQPRLRQAL